MPGHWAPRRPDRGLDERERGIVALGAAIDRAYNAKDDDALIEALRAAVAHPCAHHEFDLPSLLSGLSEELDRRGDYEGALARRPKSVGGWSPTLSVFGA